MSITANTMVLDGDAGAMYAEGPRTIAIRDNDLNFTDAAPNGSGIHLQAINGPIEQAMITGNTVTGPLSAGSGNSYFAAVRLDARPHKFGDVTVALNNSRGATTSLLCSQTATGLFPQPITSLGNRCNVAPSCPVAPLQPGQ